MNVRRTLVAGAASVALVAGTSVFSTPLAGAGDGGSGPVPVTLSCLGANPDTQTLLDLLGSLQTPPVPPPVALPVTADVTADVPETAAVGDTVPVSFESELLLSDTLIEAAAGFGITAIDVSNLVLNVQATGGGTGGPYPATPSSFTIGLAPPSVPTLTAGGDVEITDDTQATLFAVVDPVSFDASFTLLGNETTISLICEVPEGTYVAAINGSVPPPPSTTTTTAAAAPTTTTTAAPAQPAQSQPRFTG